MDLLSTLSGMAPDVSAESLASTLTSDGGGTGCCPGDGAFQATLTALLGPSRTSEADVEALAAAVAELDDAEASTLADALASVWPLPAFLAAGEAARPVPTKPDGASAGDDVPSTGGSPVGPVPEDDVATDVPVAAGREPVRGASDPNEVGDARPTPMAPEVETAADAELEDVVRQVREPGPVTTMSDPVTDAEGGRHRPVPSGATPLQAPIGEAGVAGAQLRTAGGAEALAAARPVERSATPRSTAPAEPVTETPRASVGAPAETQPSQPGLAATMQGRPALGMADGVRRVLEAIELLENAPPPRQLTIEIGEARLRVALEDGQVRLSVMEGGSDDLDELISAAEDALAEQGFDLGRDGPRDEPSDDRPTTTDQQRPRTTRSTAPGLRL